MVATDERGEILNGAFQVAGSSTDSCEVKLHDASGDLLWEDDAPTPDYTGAWNGLALTYSLVADLDHSSSGQIICPTGAVISSTANILQNFWESMLSNPLDSGTVEISC